MADLFHIDGGKFELLACDGHFCFGNRDMIHEHLSTPRYCKLLPLIPPEHLYASSVLHLDDEGTSWLLHTGRVPMLPNSRRLLAVVLNSLLLRLLAVLHRLLPNIRVQA